MEAGVQYTGVKGPRAARRRVFAVATALVVGAVTACQPGTSAPPPTVPLPAGATVVDISPPGGDLFLESEVGSPSVVLYDRLSGAGGDLWLYDDSTGTTEDLGLPFTARASASNDGSVIVFSSADPTLQTGPLAANCKVQPAPFTPLQTAYCSELYLLDRTDGTTHPLTGVGGSSTVSSTSPIVSADGTTVTFWSGTGPVGPPPVRLVMDLATGAVSPAPPLEDPNSWDYGQLHLTWTYEDGLVRTDTITGDVEQLALGGSNTPWDRSSDGRYVVMGSYADGFDLLDVVDGSTRAVPVPNVDDTATRYVGMLYVDAPGADRLIVGDIPPEA
ncbi:hypothetical protein [Dermatobacter hominis]|uniref:hypothetical protein n=1 Tax=Dermatobacter hominis TaxID=2884263 RepID=UPI001D127A29|nr:hypothetical protein [Dermatobacter hominis]UDY35848.1 hypothetical protein LH044_21335 [Dermatobacter hominis]